MDAEKTDLFNNALQTPKSGAGCSTPQLLKTLFLMTTVFAVGVFANPMLASTEELQLMSKVLLSKLMFWIWIPKLVLSPAT